MKQFIFLGIIKSLRSLFTFVVLSRQREFWHNGPLTMPGKFTFTFFLKFIKIYEILLVCCCEASYTVILKFGGVWGMVLALLQRMFEGLGFIIAYFYDVLVIFTRNWSITSLSNDCFFSVDLRLMPNSKTEFESVTIKGL